MIGARSGALTGLRRLVANALARDLRGFVVPGMDVAWANGLDLAGTGLHLATTPRHASVLVIIGPLPAGLADAASVAHAQMPRPRAILALEAGDLAPLPAADATGALTQAGLVAALADLRRTIANGAFGSGAREYSAPALETRIEYTCPMHPEVVSDQPGNCPKCGMTLVPRETAAPLSHAGHAMPDMSDGVTAETPPDPVAATHQHGAHHPSGDTKTMVEDTHAGHGHDHAKQTDASAQYTCPMHPEVTSDQPGSCRKCGMFLVPVEDKDAHAGHGHTQTDHSALGSHSDHSAHGGHSGHGAHGGAEVAGIEAHFMSMVDLTRDMPASADGLKMEWIDVPFGPFFPGLPGGLELELTLDGDAVAAAKAESGVSAVNLLREAATSPEAFIDQLAALSPLSPVAYRELACRALEQAAGQNPASDTASARAAAVERERIASHLNWLAGFGTQSGLHWLERRAAGLQLELRHADARGIAALTPRTTALLRRLHRTPLLHDKLNGNGKHADGDALSGPVARAAGSTSDARSDNPVYGALGFGVLTGTGGDARARLTQRTGEIAQSLGLIARAGQIAMPEVQNIGSVSGKGEAIVETPRGAAQLRLTLTGGKVTQAEISTPTAALVALIGAMARGRELGDAMTAIGSLDISPWELTA